MYADIVNIDQFKPIGEVEYFFYGKVPKLPYEELQEIVERFHLAEWNGETYPTSSEQEEKSFRLLIEYQSGESIMASGDSLPMDMRRRKMRSSHFSGIIFRRIVNNL